MSDTQLVVTARETTNSSIKNAYFSSNSTNEEYLRIMKIDQLLGTQSLLSDKADGTIIGALKELYNKLGKYSFSVNIDNNSIEVSEVNKSNSKIELDNNVNESDLEKITHLENLIGDKNDLTNLNQKTVVNALLDLYSRTSGLSFINKNNTTNNEEE